LENYSNKLNEIFRGSNRAHGTFTVDIATTGQKKSGKAKTTKHSVYVSGVLED